MRAQEMIRNSDASMKDAHRSDEDENAYQRVARALTWDSSGLARSIKLEVISRSMLPMLRPGDKVVVEKAEPKSLRIGDLVVVQRGGEFITHRLVGGDRETWITKGDGWRHLDAPVSKDALLGKVVAIERDAAQIDLQNNSWKLINLCLGYIHRWIGSSFGFLRAWKSRLTGKG